MALLLENVHASLIKFCKDLNLSDVQLVDFEAHAEMESLPESDCIGLSSFSIVNDNKVHDLAFAIGYCSFNDLNLFRMRGAMAKLYDALAPEKRIPLVDADTGSPLGNIVMTDGTVVSPMSRAEVRAYRSIVCSGVIAFN
jgi:hypothetical protein